MNKEKFAELDQTILPWLGRTMKALDYFMIDNFEAKGLNLTKAQMIILKILSKEDGIVQNDLAFITNRDKASLTRLIDTLEKKNFVTRSISPKDKRVKLVHITDEGKKMFDSALPVLNNIIQSIQEGISPKEIESAINVLKKIRKNINADELTPHFN
jgi:DNA-binding MarR family transcriptional regulator